jgi:tRNA dimethylallyltransferase
MVSAESRPELLVIVGETASGKSDLALKVAKAYRGEIISADSWTVYKGFDIGTGKPTTTQQKAVKHHLLDVRQPTDGFNAPMFKDLAEKAINDIQKWGKLPILVGGTGLYIDSVLYDFGFLPDVSRQERAKLDSMHIGALIELAEELNIDLSGIDIRNKRRIIRAIEAKGEKPTRSGLRAGTLIIGLQLSREVLRKQIEGRVEGMVKRGLEQEVKALSDKYGWEIEPMKGIGYRAFREYIEGSIGLDEAKERFVKGDLNLAKRQRTWFKRDKNIQWFSSVDDAYRYVSKTLNT